MWRLLIEKGNDKGLKVKIKGDGVMTVGRQSTNKLVVNDELISRNHCRIISRGGRLFIEDLSSSHGTFVNYEKIKRKELNSGDMVLIGHTEIWIVGEEINPVLGKVIGGYMFHFMLGRGGQGVVYLAEQVNLKRTVAVKVLDQKLATDKNYKSSFVGEARTAAVLSHENLIGIYDIHDDGENVFFSMEHMAGGSIADMISTEGKIPHERFCTYIIAAAKGLDYIHDKGFVHKDIKPANFMLDSEDTLKIGDFGITATNNDALKEKRLMGSPHFMSPEHILKQDMGTRSDLYSLGCSAYRMITGNLPFTGKSIKETMMAHLKQPAPSFKNSCPEMNLRTSQVLDRLLQKDAAKRFESADHFIASFKKSLSAPIGKKSEKRKVTPGKTLHKRKIFRRR